MRIDRPTVLRVLAGAALIGLAACSAERAPASQAAEPVADDSETLAVVAREVDAGKGRALFIAKGCVICHAANGVGGKAAPALDAPIGAPPIDPLDFAARMWRGAPAMIELQAVELGYTIYLTADEIADLAAFADDRAMQETLTEASLPEDLRDSLLDEQFWEVEDWDEYLRGGREGDIPRPEEVEDPAP